MSESEIGKLYGELKAVNAKIDHLTELFNRAAYGEGFVRCARHSNRLKHAEADIELCHGRVSGVKKWLVGAMGAVLAALAGVVWSLVQDVIKH